MKKDDPIYLVVHQVHQEAQKEDLVVNLQVY
jgi:hypothetical protein